MKKEVYNFYKQHRDWQEFYKELLDENEVAQITVTNCTNEQRIITLWGANKCAPISDNLFSGDFDTREVAVGQLPYKVVYNPVNNLFYVINNGSDTLSIIDDDGQLINTVNLRTVGNTAIGVFDIVVNTNTQSPQYGFVAVIGNILSILTIIDLNFNIERRISYTGLASGLGYNPIGDQYYIINNQIGSVSRYSLLNNQQEFFLPFVGVNNIGINSDNGDIYFYENDTNTVKIYDTNRTQRSSLTIPNNISVNATLYYHPVNRKMYVGFNQNKAVMVINTDTLRIDKIIDVGNNPVAIDYNPIDNYIYVANERDQTFTRIDANLEIVDTISIGTFTRSFAVCSNKGYIAFTNRNNNTLTIYGGRKLIIKINDDYEQIRQDFKYNPMIITHMKVVATTDARINTLQIIETSISGKETCEPISLRSYHSPQGFGNVSEVFEMEGYIIDGRVCWRFTINPNQQVTFLLYYKQLEMYNFLPDKARVSTGVEMSKGIPLSWIQED